jgi:hypothetical protein
LIFKRNFSTFVNMLKENVQWKSQS